MSTVTRERKTLNAARFAHSPRCPRPAWPRPARLPQWPDFPYQGFRCHGMAARARCLGASGQQGQAAREAPGGRRSPERSCRSRPEAARLETPSRARSASRVIGCPCWSWCSAAARRAPGRRGNVPERACWPFPASARLTWVRGGRPGADAGGLRPGCRGGNRGRSAKLADRSAGFANLRPFRSAR